MSKPSVIDLPTEMADSLKDASELAAKLKVETGDFVVLTSDEAALAARIIDRLLLNVPC